MTGNGPVRVDTEQMPALGHRSVLDRPKLGVLSSVRCPGSVILALYDLARSLRDSGLTFVGGFQSPVERDFLDILLRGSPRVIICPARGIARMRVRDEWRKPLAEGRLLFLSPFQDSERRPRRGMAQRRNELVAALADRVLIGHAAPGGATDRLARQLLGDGKPVFTIDDPANAALLALGAVPATAKAISEDSLGRE